MAEVADDILVLDANYLPTTKAFRRVQPKVLLESHYDGLIKASPAVLGSLLVKAGVLEKDSKLELWATQLAMPNGRLDFLFAEVGPVGEFRRAVILEDKLVRNPEARFQVLGQLIRYAYDLRQFSADDDRLPAHPTRGQTWRDDNLHAIDECLAHGRFLLIVAGDRVHSALEGMLRWFREELDASLLTEVVTVALGIYSDGDTALLVPSVTGFLRLDREMTFTVRIPALPGTPRIMSTAEQVSTARAQASQEEFFATWTDANGPADAAAARVVLDAIRAANIPGVELGITDAGAPTVALATDLSSAKVFNVQDIQRTFADGLHGLARRKLAAVPAIEAFRAALKLLGGSATASGRVHLPVAKAAQSSAQIIDAIRQLAAALDELAETGDAD